MIHDNRNFDRYEKICGSRYVATMLIAKLAREVVHQYDHVIDVTEAISWILSGVVPKNILNHDEIIQRRKERYLNYAKEYLAPIIDKDVVESVLESLVRSKHVGHLIYYYQEVYDEYRRIRIRILTKRLWTELRENQEL